jgi:DNA polymerase III epsilon subunit-like protein
MTNNIMIDLETMGKGSDSAIIAIGAVRFSNEIEDKFYVVVDLQSSIDMGLNMDASTVCWWLKQSDEARAKILEPGISLPYALTQLGGWIGKDAKVWGNGASFDNAILATAYKKARLKQPWKYYDDRCYRTLKNLFPEIKMDRAGVHHCAVDDAESQAIHLLQITKHITKLNEAMI